MWSVPVTADQLREAQEAFEVAETAREAARERRNQLVGEARREGWTQQQIADATGITRGRVNQLA